MTADHGHPSEPQTVSSHCAKRARTVAEARTFAKNVRSGSIRARYRIALMIEQLASELERDHHGE